MTEEIDHGEVSKYDGMTRDELIDSLIAHDAAEIRMIDERDAIRRATRETAYLTVDEVYDVMAGHDGLMSAIKHLSNKYKGKSIYIVRKEK